MTATELYQMSEDAHSHLRRLMGGWGMLADLCIADLLLFVPVMGSKASRFMILGQIRPTTGQTLHREDLVWVNGTYRAASLAMEGFIHCSYRDRVAESARLYFPGNGDLVVLHTGLGRAPLLELVKWTAWVWPVEVALLLLPPGMIDALTGHIDDGWHGTLSWFWVACAVTTIALAFVTRAALKERAYSAVMAATGLLYLAILTAFGTDLVARAILAG